MKRILIVILLLIIPSTVIAEMDMIKIRWIESKHNPFDYNRGSKATGWYQITPICLEEWNNFHPFEKYTWMDLFKPWVNTRIADWYLHIRIPQMLRYYGFLSTERNVLISYNAGIDYLVSNRRLPQETVDYLKQYFE